MMATKKDDNNKEHHDDHEIHHDEFEEEFEFESEPIGDVLGPDEVESEEHAHEADHEKEVKKASPKNMMLPMLIVLAVFGFIIWKLYGMFFTPKETAQSATISSAAQMPNIQKAGSAAQAAAPQAATPQAAAQAPQAAPQAAMPQVTAQPATAPSVVPTEKAPQSNIPTWEEAPKSTATTPIQPTLSEEALNKLQKKIDDEQNITKQHFLNLEKELSQTIQNTNMANRNMGALQHDISNLSAAVQALTAELKAMRSEQDKMAVQQAKVTQQKKHAPAHAHKKTSNTTYSVYAIIPGRAWLREPNGKTITVSEGDPIGEYGKILKIDAGNGVVITTSGVTLR